MSIPDVIVDMTFDRAMSSMTYFVEINSSDNANSQ
jgi:hypothetical protein